MSDLPDALVFDFDGLILDTEWPEFRSIAEVYGEHGVELVLEEWQQIVGTADHPHWTEMLQSALGTPIDDLDAVHARRLEHHHGLIALEEVRPGVQALVEEASDAGVRLGVASSSPRSWVEGHLQERGLRPFFEVVFTRDDVERAKPDPALFRIATEALGADPVRTVALEDSHHGVTSAKAAGLWAVACPNRVTGGLDFSHADLVVESLADIDLPRLTTLLHGSGQG
jgi:HAD superfamily hydrolase (TIGR01509 family)